MEHDFFWKIVPNWVYFGQGEDVKLTTELSEKARYSRKQGPYWEKLCHRSCVRPEAAGRGPYSRPRAQFFPIRTDLGRQITCLLFSSVDYFVSSFWVEFSLKPFSNLVFACVWHLRNRKSTQHYTHWRKLIIVCFLGHYLHFTFFAVKKKLLEKTRKLEN